MQGSATVGQAMDTLQPPISEAHDAEYEDIDKLKNRIYEEIKECNVEGGQVYSQEIFAGIEETQEQITKFLQQSDKYSWKTKKWRGLPAKPKRRTRLYPVFEGIIGDILAHFKINDRRARTGGTERLEALKHPSHRPPPSRSYAASVFSPDFYIEGRCNPAFPGDDYPSIPTYVHCATPIDVKTNSGIRKHKDCVSQLALYARECILRQHNRHFVFGMLVTPTKFQLYQFDRSGYICSEQHNINKDAALFVRMILGVSGDAERIGFDPTVYWRGTERFISTYPPRDVDTTTGGEDAGTKLGPTDATRESTLADEIDRLRRVEYKITEQPTFFRRSIRGKGTLCWHVEYKQKRYLVKEAWRYIERERETKWLEIARRKRCRGIVKMVAFQEGSRVSEDRVNVGCEDEKFMDRQWVRMVLELCGRDISHFETRVQLVGAFRDAIAGHQELWEARVLHRDISPNNILLGPVDANNGRRGVLIDLDRAISTLRQDSLAAVDYIIGTRAFQGVHLLDEPNGCPVAFVDVPDEDPNITSDTNPAHCHLDDLESFYYVLIWICISHERPGRKKQEVPRNFRAWGSPDREKAFLSKLYHLSSPGDTLTVRGLGLSEYFRPLFGLICRLHDIIRLFCSITRHEARPGKPVTELYPNAASHYQIVLDAIDETLEELEKHPEPSGGENEGITGASHKRARGSLDDEEAVNKTTAALQRHPKRLKALPLGTSN